MAAQFSGLFEKHETSMEYEKQEKSHWRICLRFFVRYCVDLLKIARTH